jgi:hypothetical protein
MTELADRFDAGPDELAAALGKRRWHTEIPANCLGRGIWTHIKPSRISLSVARERHAEAKCGQQTIGKLMFVSIQTVSTGLTRQKHNPVIEVPTAKQSEAMKRIESWLNTRILELRQKIQDLCKPSNPIGERFAGYAIKKGEV